MSKDELYRALKIFGREDLTYENDEFCNDLEEYMNIMKQERGIEVFMSTEDMVKYSKLDLEIERLNNIINELEKKLLELRLTDVDGKTIVYRLLDKLQELKGSDKE